MLTGRTRIASLFWSRLDFLEDPDARWMSTEEGWWSLTARNAFEEVSEGMMADAASDAAHVRRERVDQLLTIIPEKRQEWQGLAMVSQVASWMQGQKQTRRSRMSG